VLTTTTIATAQFEKPTGIVNSCTTTGCHTDIVNRNFMHTPVVDSKCLACHEYAIAENHLFLLKKPGNELCIDCHTERPKGLVVHKPVVDGDCLSCHDPHGSQHKAVLRKDLTSLCLDCHEEDYGKFDFVHGPVAAGACVICHEAHSSSFDGLLTDRPDRLCINCHENLVATGKEKRHMHKPMKEGCITCHDPHASNTKLQLHAPVPNLCLKCHDWVQEVFDNAKVLHKPFQEADGCTQCHNPHFSTLDNLQKQSQPELCLKCHDKPVVTSDGRTLINMKKFLEENPDHHGPIREGSCTMCHHPHASEEPNLLMKAYPQEFYVPFEIEQYALCFGCHQSDLVTDEQGVGLTKFRNGDQNLHWLHVNREKGRTCRACHEVHASKRPSHIREAVPFGSSDWMLELNFMQTPTGGSCAPGCHKPKEYSRIQFPLNELQTGGVDSPPADEVTE